jgi:hypothetical protein
MCKIDTLSKKIMQYPNCNELNINSNYRLEAYFRALYCPTLYK